MMLRHIVLFKFKDTSKKEEIDNVVRTFLGLKETVPQIVDIEWGRNISPENFHQGFTHCFVLTYRSLEDLSDYQLHPSHLEFQKVLQPHMEKVFVVDFVRSNQF